MPKLFPKLHFARLLPTHTYTHTFTQTGRHRMGVLVQTLEIPADKQSQ